MKTNNNFSRSLRRLAFGFVPSMLAATFALAACSKDDNEDDPVTPDADEPEVVDDNTSENTTPDEGDKASLVVYFSQTLPDGVDATTGATNVVREDGKSYGANQYLALQIAQKTKADTLRLTVANGYYPYEYQALATFARNEKDNGTHPALTSRKVDLTNYSNIFISTPVWWYTIPMPVYTFLDNYDLGGKNVYVATTHAGSGLADAISVIQGQEPKAEVSNDGLAVRASSVSSSSTATAVDNWLKQLEF